MSQTAYRVAPPGFVEEQWRTFEEEGIVVIEDALTNDEVRQYMEAIDRVATTLPECRDGAYCNPENIVEFDPVFTGLIDHPRHVGFAYDLYGELLKLHQSQFFVRPPGGNQYNSWHPDPPTPPAWVTSHDRVLSDPEWLESLHREQRIIMRSYDQAYQNTKPPAADFPLFLDRETGLDRDPDLYREHNKRGETGSGVSPAWLQLSPGAPSGRPSGN